MEPPDFESLNISAQPTPFTYPVCERWRDGSEGSVFHLANMFLFLGFMGGSGLYGLLYLFTFLTLGFFCATIWSWSDPCTTDTFLWTFALLCACSGQALHVSYRLRSVTFEKEFEELYSCMFKRIGVSLTQYGKIVACCERDVQTLERDHCFAVEGKTTIDKLSVLLAGRIRVTVNGEFLHYIYPFQFLDSPEWDSLRPSEEGIFQVTLRADNRCRIVTWRRKSLYLLFAKHRYLAKIFALVVRNDIADKLYSLNDKALDGSGHRYDLRLPSFCHPPPPSAEDYQGQPHPSPTPAERERRPPSAEREQKQRPPSAEREQKQRPPSAEREHKQRPPSAEREHKQRPPSAEREQKQRPPSAERELKQHPPSAEREQKQRPPSAEREQKQRPPSAERELKQRPPSAEREHKQRPPSAEREQKQRPPSAERELKQRPPSAEREHKQRPPSAEREQKQPSAEREQKQPSAEREQKQPSAEREQKQPSAEREQKQPSAERALGDEGLLWVPGQRRTT